MLHGKLVVATAHVLGGFIMENAWAGCHNGAKVLGEEILKEGAGRRLEQNPLDDSDRFPVAERPADRSLRAPRPRPCSRPPGCSKANSASSNRSTCAQSALPTSVPLPLPRAT